MLKLLQHYHIWPEIIHFLLAGKQCLDIFMLSFSCVLLKIHLKITFGQPEMDLWFFLCNTHWQRCVKMFCSSEMGVGDDIALLPRPPPRCDKRNSCIILPVFSFYFIFPTSFFIYKVFHVWVTSKYNTIKLQSSKYPPFSP